MSSQVFTARRRPLDFFSRLTSGAFKLSALGPVSAIGV